MKKTVLFILVAFVGMAACKKYEEGPFISFRSPEKRLCKTWYLKELTDQDNNSYDVNENTTATFDKNGNVYIHYYNTPLQRYQTDTNQWRFVDNKKNVEIASKTIQVTVDTLADSIAFHYETVTVYDTIFINRLTNKDFWFIWHDNHSPTKYFNYKYSSEK